MLVMEFGSSLGSSPAAFGLCITYALDLSAFLKFGTKMTLDIQRGKRRSCKKEHLRPVPPRPSKSFSRIDRVVACRNCSP